MPKTLSGVRVLDLTRLLPGGLCTLLLADLGASVIKIEDPYGGDYARTMPPLLAGQGAAFLALNRNKRSLVLDLKAERGQAVFKRLLTSADVLVEGFRPGVMARLGLGHEACRELNPRLVYCSLSGWGQVGPLSHSSGHDLNYVAMSGILGAMAQPGPPGGQIADVGGAYLAVMGILAALLERERSGQGTYLDVSLAEAALPFALMAWVDMLATGKQQGPTSLSGALACYGIYETRDGQHVALAALESKFWHNFCEAVDRPDWAGGDHREPARQADLKRELTALFASRTAREWQDVLAEADCCFSLLVAPGRLTEGEQFHIRGNLGVSGDGLPWMRSPLRVGDDGEAIQVDVPGYGEHSREVLREAGYTREEIDVLVAQRVIL